VGLLAGAGVLLRAPGAAAHAILSSSVPEDGAQVVEAPARVALVFTEEPEPDLSEVEVLDSSAAVVSTGPARPSAGDPKRLEVPVPDLPEGVYTVSWRVVSKVDGHATAGAFAFGVGVSPEGAAVVAPRVEEPPISPIEVAGRWLLLGGLGLLVGGAWVGALAFARPPRGVLLLMSVAWAVAAVGLLALATGQWRAAGVGIGRLLGTPIGAAILLRTAAVVGVGLAVVVAVRLPGPARGALVLGGAMAAAGSLAHVAAGHAGAADRPTLEIAAQWVHVVASGVWLGGLGALLAGIRGEPGDAKTRAVRRFSAAAGVAFFVVAGTGVVRAVEEIPTWSDLFSSAYGRLVVTKVALLLALGALGARNRYRNVPRASRTLLGLRRVSGGELTLAVAVLGVAALMASVSPPYEGAAGRASPEVVVSGTDFARSVRVRLSAQPGTAGPNQFQVRLSEPDDGAAVGADRVALRFSYLGGGDVGPATLELRPTGEGRFTARGSNLSLAGRWEVTVILQRGAGSTEIPLVLGTSCGARSLGGEPTIYSVDLPSGSVQGYLDPGAAGQNEVHVTYFDDAGTELEVEDDATITASRGADSMGLEPRRLGPGHFVAGAELEAGRWRFDFAATATDGSPLAACFEQMIGGGDG
jgi:copper transport protein